MDCVKIDRQMLANSLPQRSAFSHKGTYGQAVIIGGSFRYVGAPCFAAQSADEVQKSLAQQLVDNAHCAMRVGAGTSVLALPDFLAKAVYPSIRYSAVFPLSSNGKDIVFKQDEIDALLKNATSFAIGNGMNGGNASAIVKHALAQFEMDFVIDADALATTKEIADFDGRAVLTPHLGEMAKLLDIPVDAVKNNAAEIAKDYALLVNAVVVLKGSPVTYVSDGETVFENCTGNARLAKGGSGDVLAGIIAGLLAWGKTPIEAAKIGTWLLGRSAELCNVNAYSCLPLDVIDCIGKAVEELMTD